MMYHENLKEIVNLFLSYWKNSYFSQIEKRKRNWSKINYIWRRCLYRSSLLVANYVSKVTSVKW